MWVHVGNFGIQTWFKNGGAPLQYLKHGFKTVVDPPQMGPARDFVEVTGLQPVLCSGQVASLGPKRLKTSQKGTQNSGGESNHSVYVFFFHIFHCS